MLVDMHSRLVPLGGNKYENDEEALRILKSAVVDGITHIIATPLYQNDSYMDKEQTIGNHVKRLNSTLVRLDIPVTVFEGMEIVLYERIVQDIKQKLLPLADSKKYVLISFKDQEVPSFALNVFFEMQLMGYVPIIANVEQNVYLMNNTKKLQEFINKGALVHVGTASILGLNGRNTQRKAIKLCRSGLVQLISSASSESKSQLSLLKPAYEYLGKKLSTKTVEYFIRNAESVVNGSDFLIQNPMKFGKK